ncbi:unnamed protein product [Mytilus edulis]|uniref:Uncharacterized protein n=1 Tax=Mytilus edulis TaxID=6550 RepID=A0A8S3VR50_MYTED|nr:unnamed protein product [Mytilus edulis]
MLLQVDKSLGMSQFLLLGTVVNFTLAKRQEILDKSTVSEALQQRLVSSPLSKDKLFSVSLEQLQEELNKALLWSRWISMGSDNFRQVGTFDFTEGIGTSVSGTASFSPVPINLSVTKDSQKNQLLQDEVNILIQKDGGVLSSYSGSTHSLLPRRFSYQESLPISFGGTHQFVYPFTPETGFFISWEKSEIIPSQIFNFLGEPFRTDLGLVLPQEEKVVKVSQLALTQFSSVPARQLLQLVGFLISIMDVIPLGRLHIRPIQWYLSEFWHPISQLWEAPVPILPPLLPHLQWWLQENIFGREFC